MREFLKKHWWKIVIAIVITIIVFRFIDSNFLSAKERAELELLKIENKSLSERIKVLRLEKIKAYDSIISLSIENEEFEKSIDEISKRHEKIRSQPIPNSVGDSLARAIIRIKQRQH